MRLTLDGVQKLYVLDFDLHSSDSFRGWMRLGGGAWSSWGPCCSLTCCFSFELVPIGLLLLGHMHDAMRVTRPWQCYVSQRTGNLLSVIVAVDLLFGAMECHKAQV